MNREGNCRPLDNQRSQRPAMRPRSLTTPWLMDEVRDALASQGERKAPERDRRRQLRMLFGV
ncbi:MAG: hypothetical protein FJZ01_02905 [Candidatus Sericytochromatia bacterium]|nr:hypothetical protein [Candidatus Tanganyikabacteria bacterium]